MAKKLAAFFFLCLWTSFAHGQVTVEPLMDDESLRTHLLLPFKLSGVPSGESRISATLSGNDSCRILQDPFWKNNFLMKCTSEGPVTLQFKITGSAGHHQLSYGPVTIYKISDGEIINPGDNGLAARIAEGKNLFNSFCISCHQPVNKAGRTPAQISGAINSNTGGMGNLKSVLNSNQIESLSIYLQNLGL